MTIKQARERVFYSCNCVHMLFRLAGWKDIKIKVTSMTQLKFVLKNYLSRDFILNVSSLELQCYLIEGANR